MKYTHGWTFALALLAGCGGTVITDWGTGTTVGFVAGDVWTPARDENGVVNLVSWDAVPKGRWIEVQNSRIDSLDGAVRAAVKGWSTADLWWPGVTNSWSWPAVDIDGSRFWVGPGGGPQGGNNGLYRFDLLKMSWAIEAPPSDPSLWSAAYRTTGSMGGSYTDCMDSNELRKQRVLDGTWKDINDVSGDEIFWDYPDHPKPTARRVYHSLVYAPGQDALFLSARRLWKYDLGDSKWSYRRDLRTTDGDSPAVDLANVTVYDELKKQILQRGGLADVVRNLTYDVGVNEFGATFNAAWETLAPAVDRHARELTVIRLPTSNGTLGDYQVYSLDTRGNTTAGVFQLGTGMTQESFSAATYKYDHGGLVYVPPLGRYWAWARAANGVVHPVEIDPTTIPWTINALTQTGSRVAIDVTSADGHPVSKPMWFPKLNAVVFMNTNEDRLAIFRF